MDEIVSNRLISLQTPHTLSAPQTNLHLDILMGRDETIEAADVFLGQFSSSLFFNLILIMDFREGDWFYIRCTQRNPK